MTEPEIIYCEKGIDVQLEIDNDCDVLQQCDSDTIVPFGAYEGGAISPTATAEEIPEGVKFTVTDKNGRTVAILSKPIKGTDYFTAAEVEAIIAQAAQAAYELFEIYGDSYTATPVFEAQVLNTHNKIMSDDVTVEAIPVSSVENLSGGNTVYIGGNINA